jgi:ElaB/YqjD/DUF883 family membrane-anchored ribosome-binding protein
MKKHTSDTPDLASLAEDAKTLLSATADVAEDKVIEARKRLTAALENGKEIWNDVQAKAVESVKATDKVIRTHPYQSIGIAFGVGALIGYLTARRK